MNRTRILATCISYEPVFSALQHIIICLARYMQSLVRLSVCLSVTRVDQSKTFEVKIKNFHRTYVSPIPLIFTRQVLSTNSNGFPAYFLALNVNISKR